MSNQFDYKVLDRGDSYRLVVPSNFKLVRTYDKDNKPVVAVRRKSFKERFDEIYVSALSFLESLHTKVLKFAFRIYPHQSISPYRITKNTAKSLHD